jgi:hypothetical protein
MASIVTEELKQKILDTLRKDILGGDGSYYIGISRAEPWNVADSAPSPVDDIQNQEDFRKRLQGVSKVTRGSLVVSRHDWTTGTTYSQYDDKNSLTDYSTSFYVKNLNNSVYICLRSGVNSSGNSVPSTVEPVVENLDPFELSDGYVWKFLYAIGGLDANLFLSSNFMPVGYQESVDSNSTGNQLKQYNVQQAAKSKMITSFIVDTPGSGYSVPQLELNASVNSDVDFTLDSSGSILKIEYKNDSSTLSYIHGVSGAVINIIDSGGAGASIRAVLSSSEGIGKSAVRDLRAKSFMVAVRIPGALDDFITAQDFRQVGLIQGMKDSANGTHFESPTGQVLYSMTLSSSPSSFTNDLVIVGTTSGAKAWINNAATPDQIYYHQNDSTGYLDFVAGESVTEVGGVGAGTIDSPKVSPEVSAYTGSILYISNTGAIERTADQTEDIKVVIDLDNCFSV